jgi:hypothetical protein
MRMFQDFRFGVVYFWIKDCAGVSADCCRFAFVRIVHEGDGDGDQQRSRCLVECADIPLQVGWNVKGASRLRSHSVDG